MNEEAIGKAIVGVGITAYVCHSGIVDEASYKQKLKVITGISNGESVFSPEPTVNWDTFKTKYDDVMNTHALDKLREMRNVLLERCDWTQGEDVPHSIKDKWQSYRQALRNLPSVSTPTLNADGSLNESSVTWPTQPS